MISAKELMNIPRKTASQVLASVPGGRGYDERLLRAVEEAEHHQVYHRNFVCEFGGGVDTDPPINYVRATERADGSKRLLGPGDRIVIIGDHPHATKAGTIIAFEEYGPDGGLRWKGARIALDVGGECYADAGFLRRTA